MNKSFIIVFVGIFGFGFSQTPTGYYDGTTGISGYTLKTMILKNLPKGIYIIKTGELNTKFIAE